MADLKMNVFHQVNLARCLDGFKHPLELWTPDDWLAAVVGECGEAANVVKKLNRRADGIVAGDPEWPLLVKMLADEITDAIIYLDLLAARVDAAFLRNEAISVLVAFAWREGLPSSGSAACREVAKAVGRLAMSVEDAPPRPKSLSHTIENVALALTRLALKYEIDLAAAIVSKFNATSEKLGLPDRLYAHG